MEEEFPLLLRAVRPFVYQLNRALGIEATFWFWLAVVALVAMGALLVVKRVFFLPSRQPNEEWEVFQPRQRIAIRNAKVANSLVVGAGVVAGVAVIMAYIS